MNKNNICEQLSRDEIIARLNDAISNDRSYDIYEMGVNDGFNAGIKVALNLLMEGHNVCPS